MSVKKALCDIVITAKEDLNYTYDHLAKETGLTRSQIGLILKNEGKGVSTANIEFALKKLGYGIEVQVRTVTH